MTATITPPCSPVLRSSGGGKNEKGKVDEDEDFVVARCQEIIDHYEEESHKSDNEMARWVVEQLTRDEQEVAAECSYAYWFLSTSQNASQNVSQNASQMQLQMQNSINNNKPLISLTESVRFATAMREAIRHMDCADNVEEVLKLLRSTLQFHAKHKTKLYRTCMTKTTSNEEEDGADDNDDDDDNNKMLSRQRRERIHDEMNNYMTNVVRGHDREHRAIFFAFPRSAVGTSEDAFVDSVTYTVERAVACSEFQSIGRQDQMFCVVDTKNGSCPPFKSCQAALGILQNYYPGRLKNCIILNPPYLVMVLYKMIKPFMDPLTAAKFLMLSGKNKQKKNEAAVSPFIDESQAMPVLMPGKGKLTAEVDIDHFLYRVPFYRLYDDTNENENERREQKQKHRITTSSSSTASTTSSLSTDSGKKKLKSEKGSSSSSSSSSNNCSEAVKRRKPVVSVRSLAIGEIVIKYTSTSPPQYQSEVKLNIHPIITTDAGSSSTVFG